MKRLPESWKSYFLLLSILVLVLTVVGDQYRPSPEPEVHASSSDGHSHDHAGAAGSPKSLDEAFSQTPDPGAVPVDPVKEHRMAKFHYNEGNRFLNQGNWETAVGNYKMALHHDPALNEAYINMSNAYLKGQQYEEAKKTLDALQLRDPDNPHLHYNLACYFSLTHREAASLDALQHSFRLGYPTRRNAQTDPDLANLRQTREFQQWVKTVETG